MDIQTEKLIVENVLNALLQRGIIGGADANSGITAGPASSAASVCNHGKPLTLEPKDKILVENHSH